MERDSMYLLLKSGFRDVQNLIVEQLLNTNHWVFTLNILSFH